MDMNGQNLDGCTFKNQATGKPLRDSTVCKGLFARFFARNINVYIGKLLSECNFIILRNPEWAKEQKLFRCASIKYQMGLYWITSQCRSQQDSSREPTTSGNWWKTVNSCKFITLVYNTMHIMCCIYKLLYDMIFYICYLLSNSYK